jgi:hypothetical protein
MMMMMLTCRAITLTETISIKCQGTRNIIVIIIMIIILIKC